MVTPDKKSESSSAKVVRSFIPRDAQRVCSVKSDGHESALHGSYVCRHRRTTASDAVHDAFMTLS